MTPTRFKRRSPPPDDPIERELRARLGGVSQALVDVHKVLVDLARREHEREHGPVAGPLALYNLLTTDERFAWLREMSSLMAAIDEAIDGPDPLVPAGLGPFRARVEALVTGDEPPEGSFAARYLVLLHQSHDLLLAHLPLRRALDRM